MIVMFVVRFSIPRFRFRDVEGENEEWRTENQE
jgi:hypothetical protein